MNTKQVRSNSCRLGDPLSRVFSVVSQLLMRWCENMVAGASVSPEQSSRQLGLIPARVSVRSQHRRTPTHRNRF